MKRTPKGVVRTRTHRLACVARAHAIDYFQWGFHLSISDQVLHVVHESKAYTGTAAQ
jgi:hypothetical protein